MTVRHSARAAECRSLVVPENVRGGVSSLRWDLSGFAPGASGIMSLGEGDVTIEDPPSRLMQAWCMPGPVGRIPASRNADGFSAAWLGSSPFDGATEMAWAAEMYAYLDQAFGYMKPAPRYRVFMRFLDTRPGGGATAFPASFMLSRMSAPQ